MTHSSKRVLITDYMRDDTDLEESILNEAGIEVTVAESQDPSSWLSAALEADGTLTRHAPITADTIKQLAQCRIISRYCTGTDNIDAGSAEEQGIQVAYVAGYSTSEVADHSWAMALGLSRGVPLFNCLIADGGWQPAPLPTIHRLEGQTIGLIGYIDTLVA
jgi:D-3-phosphoglycerate dehydrogenase